eukprot:scaffold6263_cov192-Alexandrium_tamarense.AAC.8
MTSVNDNWCILRGRWGGVGLGCVLGVTLHRLPIVTCVNSSSRDWSNKTRHVRSHRAPAAASCAVAFHCFSYYPISYPTTQPSYFHHGR